MHGLTHLINDCNAIIKDAGSHTETKIAAVTRERDFALALLREFVTVFGEMDHREER